MPFESTPKLVVGKLTVVVIVVRVAKPVARLTVSVTSTMTSTVPGTVPEGEATVIVVVPGAPLTVLVAMVLPFTSVTKLSDGSSVDVVVNVTKFPEMLELGVGLG